ncbi:DUF2085 domain-containing protein [bacterium]|nr:DUF2085 domain-containing protein [bacterium]
MDNFIYDLLGGFCSQDPGHTFACVRGELGLCARCFGIYCGIFAAYIYYLFTRKSERHHLLYFLAGVLVSIVYFLLSHFFAFPYNRVLVYFLGGIIGFGLGLSAIFNLFGRYKISRGSVTVELSYFLIISSLILALLMVFRAALFFNLLLSLVLISTVFLIIAGIVKGFTKKKALICFVTLILSIVFLLLSYLLLS